MSIITNGDVPEPEFEFNDEAFALEMGPLMEEYGIDLLAIVAVDVSGKACPIVIAPNQISPEQRIELAKSLLNTVQKWDDDRPRIIMP